MQVCMHVESYLGWLIRCIFSLHAGVHPTGTRHSLEMSNNCAPGLRNVAALLSLQPRTSTSASLLTSLLRRQTFSTKTATPRPRRKITLIAGGVACAAAVAYDGFVNGFERIGGAHRFIRCLGIAATISADYAWNLNGLDEDEPDYARRIGAINQRSADRLLAGCLANGGLYVKIGQGVSAINHILPREYTETLKQLEVISKYNEHLFPSKM